MPEAISKTQRWLDLISFLLGRHLPVSVEEIMEGVPSYAGKWETGSQTARESARRTFERDKDELRRLGIPLETVTYSIGYGMEEREGYRLQRKDFYLPYLRLLGEAAPPSAPAARLSALRDVEISPEEADVALDALELAARAPSFPYQDEARSAYRKLVFDLQSLRFRRTPVLFVDRPGAQQMVDRLRLLSEALLARKRVRFRYHGIYRGEDTDREVAPYGLLFQRGHWYLVGHDTTRDGLRVFRAGRMEDVTPNAASPNTPDYEIPAGFTVDDFRGRQAWELGSPDEEPLEAHILFHFPRSLWAERNGYGRLVAQRDDGAAVRGFDVQQVSPFLRWILGLGGEAEVVGPAELARELRALALEVAALYEVSAAQEERGDA